MSELGKWAEARGWEVWYEDTHAVYCKSLTGEAGKVAHRYLFVEVTDMQDACGDDWRGGGGDQFVWEVQLVDVLGVDASVWNSALDYCGQQDYYAEMVADEELDDGEKLGKLFPLLADALRTHGTRAPLDDDSAPRFGWAVSRGVKRAEEILADERLMEDLLDRPVNRIGSSARDFMGGDCLAGLRRYAGDVQDGERAPDCPASNLMLKMYGAAGGRTLGGSEPDLGEAGNDPVFDGETV
jgi:hypothetical protein